MKTNAFNRSNHPKVHDHKLSVSLYVNERPLCHKCLRELSGYTFLLIDAECYCIICVSSMKKVPSNYHVINKLSFPVYHENWTAYEEVMLFEGLQKHGFGNWSEIADFIDSNKTREDVEEHYTKLFLNSPQLLPDNRMVLPRQTIASKNSKSIKNKNVRNRQTALKRNLSSAKDKKKEKSSQVEVVGYMPLRADFQFEYDNEAQLFLAEMEFTDEDSEEDKQLKFKILDLYNQRLTERNRKKQFVMSRGLLDLDKQMNIEKIRTKTDKQIYNMMKIFMRFQTAEEHEKLIEGIIKEKYLKERIDQYKQLRNRGYRTKTQVECELQRKHQVKSKKKFISQFGYRNTSQENRNRRHNQQVDNQFFKKNCSYLSPDEVSLCKELKISGIVYMMIKETILREHNRQGVLQRQNLGGMFAIDKFVINSVINFLIEVEGLRCRG